MIDVNELSPYSEMIQYDKMASGVFPPYTMLANPSNVYSAGINTDEYGFRKSLYHGELLDLESFTQFKSVSLIVGASTAFGVGASSDKTTISSLLHEATGESWLNLGIRGAVSIQEYIALIMHITKFKKVKKIFFVSGINDLYRNLTDSSISKYDKRFSYLNESYSFYSARRIAFAYLRSLLSRETVDQILSPEEGVKKTLFDLEDALSIFEYQYTRNFLLYSALAKQLDCKITFGFQPFYHVAKKNGTKREREAVARTEALQVDSDWAIVRDRIIENIDFASRMFEKLSEVHDFGYLDFNKLFSDDVDYFVDSVHLTDLGNRRIVELYNEHVG